MKSKYRIISILLVMLMVFSNFTVTFADNLEEASHDAVTVDVGVPRLNVVALYGDETEEVNADDNGIASFPGLYNFLYNAGFLDAQDEPIEETVTFEINYPEKTIKERHYLEGNTLYQGKSEEYTFNSSEDWTDIALTPPERETSVVGFAYIVPLGKDESEAAPAHGLTIVSDTGETISEEDGLYTFEKASTVKIETTEDYIGDELKELNSTNVLYVWERFDANKEMYTVSPEWISESDKEITVTGAEGYTVSNGDEYLDVLKMSTSDITKLTLKDSLGHISRPFDLTFKTDFIAPRILELDVKEEGVESTSHGMYGQKEASFTVSVTVEENESGLDSISLIGEKGEYPLIDGEASGHKYTATFVVPKKEDVVKDTLTITAKDKVGNVSSAKLLKGSEDESTLTLENIPPEITEFRVAPEGRNESGWYIVNPEITVKGLDKDSGLKSIVIEINGKEVLRKDFSDKVIDEQTYSFKIPEAMISEAAEQYKIRAILTDNAGVSNVDTRIIKIDDTIPELIIEGVEPDSLVSSVGSVKVKVNDNYPGLKGENIHIKVMLRDSLDKEYEVFNKDFPSMREGVIDKGVFELDGIYTIYGSAKDVAGNESKIELTFTKDSEAPSLSWEEGYEEGSWYKEEIALGFTALDAVTSIEELKTYINGKEVEITEHKITLNSELYKELKNEAGEYEFKVVATDKQGNKSEISKLLKVDLDAPTISISGVSIDGIYKDSPEIKVNVTEEHPFSTEVNILPPNGTEAETKDYGKETELLLSGFNVEGTYNIRITSVDEAGNRAPESSIRFVIDKTAPEIVSLGVDKEPNDDGWYNDELIYSYEVKDTISGVKDIKASINGEPVQTSDGKVILTKELISKLEKESGEYEIKITSESNVGLIYDKVETFKVDIVSPEVIISGAEEGKIYNKSPEVKVTANEKHIMDITVTVEHSSDVKTDTILGKSEYTLSDFTEDGEYVVIAKATDLAGNVSIEEMVSFTLDQTAPVIESRGVKESPNELGWFNGPITFSYSIKDALSGVKSVKAYINDKEVPIKENEVSLTSSLIDELESGKYVFKIVSSDNAGNESEISETYLVDTVKPEITLSNIKEGEVYVSSPNLNIEVKDKHITEKGGVIFTEVKRNNEVIVKDRGYNHVSTVSINDFSEDGKYEVSAYAIDPAGNRSEVKKITFTVDSKDPIILDAGVKEGEPNLSGWYNAPITYQYKIDDETSGIKNILVKVNGEEASSKDGTVKITEDIIEKTANAAGTYTVEIEAEDKAGNKKLFAKTFKIDLVKPNITFTGASQGENFMNAPTITISSDEKHYSEDGAFISYEVFFNGASNGVKKVKSVGSVNVSDFDRDGRYQIKAYGKDAAGNVSSEKEISFVKDSTLPVIRIFDATSYANGNGWYNGPVSFDILAEDATSGIKSVSATVNGVNVPISNGRVNITEDLISSLSNGSGTYTVRISVVDASGNEVTSEKTVKIDTITPQVSLSGIEANKKYKEMPQLTISSNDMFASDPNHILHVDTILDGTVVSSQDINGVNTYNLSSFTNDGSYTVRVYAKDAAGNRSNEQSISFAKDSTAPAISIVGITPNDWNKGTVGPTVVITERFFNTAEAEVTLTRDVNGRSVKIPFSFSYTDLESRSSVQLTDSGKYTITVSAKDEAGNISQEKTVEFFVDVKPPILSIKGLENNKIYGYEDVMSIQIQYDDEYLDSFSYSIIKGDTEWKSNLPVQENLGRVLIDSIPKQKVNDGVYKLVATVKDKAGNITEETFDFMVVRFGSIFKIVKSPVEKYSREITEDVVVDEINFANIESYYITITRDSETVEARNVKTNKVGDTTTYTIPKSNFTKEGIYRVNIATTDSANNTSELTSQYEHEIWFAIDKTAPVISYNGIKPGETYIADTMKLYISGTDSISPEIKFSVNVNDEDVEIFEDESGSYAILNSGEKQNIVITATDLAGNTAIEKISGVTITTNEAVKIISNKPLIYGGISLIAVLIAGTLFFIAKKNKKEEETGDDIDF